LNAMVYDPYKVFYMFDCMILFLSCVLFFRFIVNISRP